MKPFSPTIELEIFLFGNFTESLKNSKKSKVSSKEKFAAEFWHQMLPKLFSAKKLIRKVVHLRSWVFPKFELRSTFRGKWMPVSFRSGQKEE